MAEDTTNPFASILGALQTKGGAKGVVKDSDGKVNPHLTPAETARYEKIFSIMKKVVDPGPEAGKVSRGASTTSEKIANTSAMQKVKSSGGIEMPGLGTLAALGGLGGVLLAAFTTLSDTLLDTVNDIVQDVVDFADSTGSAIGKLPQMALKLAKVIPLKTLKFLPLVGSLVSFGFAYDHFQKGQYISGGWELVSGIANLFPGVGTAVSIGMDMIKFMYEANAPVNAEGEEIDFGAFMKGKALEYGSIILNKIKEGKVPMLSGVWKLGEAIGYFIGGKFGEGFKSLMNFFPAFLGQGDLEQMYNAMSSLYSIVSESEPVAVAKQLAGDAWGWMKDVFSDIGKVFSSFFDGIKSWINTTIQTGKDLIWNMIPDVFKDQGLNEIKANPKMYSKKQMATSDAKLAEIRERIGNDEFLRIMTGPVAERQAFLKSQGYVKSKSINDGMISKNGQVTRFDDQDDLLAAKKNGPIDKMLDGNSKVMKSIAAINAQQLNVLVEIRDGIKSLNSGGGISFNNNSLTEEFYS